MATVKRHKVATEPRLGSWDECDQALRELGEFDLRLEAIEAKLTKQVAELKDAAAAAAKVHQENRDRLVRDVEAWCASRRLEFVDRKSRKLTHGTVGWRQSTRLKLAKADEVLLRLKGLGMHDCIRTKEAVDRDVLRAYDDARLAQVGVVRVVADEFFAEPDRAELAEGGL
jgi:phage host-nuclease inhibitor protein Gam